MKTLSLVFFYLHTRRTHKKGEESYRSFNDVLKGRFYGDFAAVIFGQTWAKIRLNTSLYKKCS